MTMFKKKKKYLFILQLRHFYFMAEHVYVVLMEHCPDTGFASFHIMVFSLIVLKVLCLNKP